MTRRQFLTITAAGSTLAVAASDEDGRHHIGPLIALANGSKFLFTASLAGVFASAPEDPNRWIKHVADPAWRVLSMAWQGETLYLAGGRPSRSGMIGRVRKGEDGSWKIEERRLAEDLVYAIAVDPSGQTLAAACHDGRVFLLETTNFHHGDPVVWQKHEGIAQAVAFSPDGSRLASAGLDGAVYLDLAGRNDPPLRLQEHTSGVTCLTFSPDGSALASGSRDAKVRLHTSTGRLFRTYSGFRAEEEAVPSPASAWSEITRLAWLPGDGEGELWAGSAEGAVYALASQRSDWQLRHRLSGSIVALESAGDRFIAVAGQRIWGLDRY